MNREQQLNRAQRIFDLSLLSLPYLIYLSLAGLIGVMLFLLSTFRQTAIDRLTQISLLVLGGLLILSSLVAIDRGEALLQLANFLPFFLLFAVLPFLFKGVEQLEQTAFLLVLTAIPLNIISLFEYFLKAPGLPRQIRRIPFVKWVRSAPHKGRAMVVFDHPNWFASYLVLMLGLGLGLVLHYAMQSRHQPAPLHPRQRLLKRIVVAATFLNLVGIFCSGSRNGLVVAVLQLAIFALLVKGRAIAFAGFAGLIGLVSVVAIRGIGGRSLSLTEWADDPRIGVWQIAIDLMRERPWLGWGLGSYKLLYPSRLIDPEYPNVFHPHNFWLMLGCETGWPFMVLFTLLIGWLCYQTTRALMQGQIKFPDREILWGYLLAFGGCVAFALFDVTLYDARINVVNWVVLGGIYLYSQNALRQTQSD